MLQTRKIKVEDKETVKQFTVTELGAVPTLKLAREIATLLVDTDLIKSVVLQQFMMRVLQTNSNSQLTNEDKQQLEELLQKDIPSIITYFVQSIISGLNDDKMDVLIKKCLSNVVYHNGTYEMNANEALELGMIEDFVVIIRLIYEVIMINFSGAIDRIKKLLTPLSKAV
jgi:hypothetical protein